MTVISVPQGGVVVERSGACLSIRAAAAPAAGRPEAMLPAEPGRTAVVVVDGAAAAALHALDRDLLGDLDRHLWTPPGGPRQGLRLLVGGAARSGADGAAPLAARLADELGVEVVAPDGPVVVLRRGELFSAGAAAAWWGFAAGRWPERTGPRFPSPAWQRDLPADIGARTSGPMAVTPVPSGLWVRAGGGPAAELSDPGFAVPPAAERLAVLVGRPGEPRPAVTGLAEVIGGLPPALRQRYVLVPYGPEPAGQAPVGQQLADRLGVDVRATHGLPYYTEDGSLDFAAVDDAGRLTWRPLVTESAYHPGAQPPTPSTWSPPLPGLPPAGPASYWLADGWLVDLLPSGLLVRPATSAPDSAVGRRAADPRHLDIVITAAFRAPDNVPVSVLGAVGRLTRALPPSGQDRLRMLITDLVDPPELLGLAGALRLPVHRLTQDRIAPVGDGATAAPADTFAAQPPVQLQDSTPEIPPADPPVQHPEPAAAPGYAEARPDSVGRLHASAVPTAAGQAAAPPPPAASADPAIPPDPSAVDDPPGGPAATAGPPSTADGTSAGRGSLSTGSGDGPPTATPAPTAPAPAPAAAASPTSLSRAEQPLPTPAPHRRPQPAADQPRDGGSAAAPRPRGESPVPSAQMPGAQMPGGPVPGRVSAPVAAAPGAAGLVLVTPDRVGGVDRWWGRPSTLPERQQFRLSLGWRFDAASRYVTRLLSQRPGLRAAAAGDDGVATDLAAVHVFAASDHIDLVESSRTGAVRPVDRAFLSCVVSGLRWLPTLTGLVVRGGPKDPADAQVYAPGSEVVEMGLLVAVADPVAEVPGGVEVLIWSSTARRLDGLVEGGEGAQVVFLPGTVFRVLEVDRAAERRRVLLVEMPQSWRGKLDPDRDERIRGRLRAAARARTADPADGDGAEAGCDGAGNAEEKAPARRWTGGSLVALPGVVPAESLSGAA